MQVPLSFPPALSLSLRLSTCGISDEGHVCLALSLMLNPCCVKELDVSDNNPGESTKNLLTAMLENPHCRIEALKYVQKVMCIDLQYIIIITFLSNLYSSDGQIVSWL